MSVPQFGGWDQNEPGAIDYTVMFTQARENKKHQKANLIEIRRKSFGSERDFVNSNHGRAPRHHVRSHTHSHAHEDHVVMVRLFSFFSFSYKIIYVYCFKFHGRSFNLSQNNTFF